MKDPIENNYADYREENSTWTADSVQKYLDKYKGKDTKLPITGEELLNLANENNFPIELMLIQGRIESNFGTKGAARKTNNIFNIGNIDAGDSKPVELGLKNGTRRMMNSWKDGIISYINTMKKEYLPRVSGNWRELLNKDNFRRGNGDRYATDKTYENKGNSILKGFGDWRNTPSKRSSLQSSDIYSNIQNNAKYINSRNVNNLLKTIDFSKSTFSSEDFDQLESVADQFLLDNRIANNSIGYLVKAAYDKVNSNDIDPFPKDVEDVKKEITRKTDLLKKGNTFAEGGFLQPNGRTTSFVRPEDITAQNNTLAEGGPIDGIPFLRNKIIGPIEFPVEKKKEYDKTLTDLSFLGKGSIKSQQNLAKRDNTSIVQIAPKNIIDNSINIKKGVILRKKSRGNNVSTLQQFLLDKGFYGKNATTKEIDGKFGIKTENALKAYQKMEGLQVDGILGKNTLNALQGFSNNISPKNLKEKSTTLTKDGITRSYKDGKLQPIKGGGLRDAFNKIVPTNIRFFVNDLTRGENMEKLTPLFPTANILKSNEGTISEKYFTTAQLNGIKKVVKFSLSKGKKSFNYSDLRKVGLKGKHINETLAILDPYFNIGTSLGQSNIEVDNNGDVFIKDTYNFNDAGSGNHRNNDPLEVGLLPAIYNTARNVGTNLGSNDKQGARVSIYIGNIKDL